MGGEGSDAAPRASAAEERQVGAWYSSWYTNTGRYIWSVGNGVGSGQQFLADVDGDGRDDAIIFFLQDGSWYVGPSLGDGFGGFGRSPHTFGANAERRLMGDVNGDGRDDAVAYAQGTWTVAAAQPSATFGPPHEWTTGHGVGSEHQFLADVDGDGRDDAVVFFPDWDGGRWYGARSEGDGFGPFSLLRSGFGGGTPKMGDVDGDGLDDAMLVSSDGRWRAAYSNGAVLTGDAAVAQGHGAGATSYALADADGDGDDDLIAFFPDLHGGSMLAALGQGRNVPAVIPSIQQPWKTGAGSLHFSADVPGQPAEYSWVGLADVTGDGIDDAVGYMGHDGSWRVIPGQYPNGLHVNTWELWDIGYRPTVGDADGYDSRDPAIADAHLEMLADAQIDFVLVDLTNGVGTQPILDGTTTLCQRIAAWNASSGHRKVRYAIAVGAMQFSSDPQTLEDEAAFVHSHFVQDPTCGGDNYYHHEGRPMLVSYSSWEQRQTWEQWGGNKSMTGSFSLRYAAGDIPSRYGIPVPESSYNEYVGWGMPEGAQPNDDIMVVMPGWNNHVGAYVSRVLGGDPLGFFVQLGWERVLERLPQMVVINSFNEFAEQTGIEPTDTSLQRAGEERWPTPDLYWDATRDYIQLYRQAP